MKIARYSRVSCLLTGIAAIGAMALVLASPAMAGSGSSTGGKAGAAYNAIPSKVSGNVPSLSFEGWPAKEFGDLVALGGKARKLDSVSVLLSSWGCETGDYLADGNCQTTPGATFQLPMTFNIYDEAGATVLATKTATITVPYRPSASALCTGADLGKWYNSSDRTCYNGLPNLVTVSMSDLDVTLPPQVIWSVQYNTTTSGYAPLGNVLPCSTLRAGCGYDTLNVGAFSYPNAPFAGTDLDGDAAFFNGAMQPDWTGSRPLGAINTK